MRRTVTLGAVLTVLTVLLVSGCGDSGSDETDTASDTTDAAGEATSTTDASETTDATEADGAGTLEGTYELTGPEPGLYECSFATEQLVMVVDGDQVTIDEEDGLITGTITPQGDVLLLDAYQPDNFIDYTITITVADGGDSFTATNDEQSKLGGCSFEFTGERTSKDASAGSTPTSATGGPPSSTPGGASAGSCDEDEVLAVVLDAYPGSEAELGICEGEWAVVAWWIPGTEGPDQVDVLHLEPSGWAIIQEALCASDIEVPPAVYQLACQTQ